MPAVQITRGERTRSTIVDACRRLFLERGYAGTTVNAITDACGISRAGFYTYFKDKREIFGLLGDAAFHDLRTVLAAWDDIDRPYHLADVTRFVRSYFEYMDRHGAFALAASLSAPDDEEFRRGNHRMQTRVAWILGQALGAPGGHSPDAFGTAVLGLLDRAWHTVQTQSVAVERDEMVNLLADMIFRMSTHAYPQAAGG